MKNISLFDISGRDYRLQRSLLFIFLFSFVVLLQLKAENWLVRGKVLDEKTKEYLQPIITQYFIDNKSEIWLLFLIAHSKR